MVRGYVLFCCILPTILLPCAESQLTVRLPLVKELRSEPITSLHDLETVLQNNRNISHVSSDTEGCYGGRQLRWDPDCGAGITSLLQRVTPPRKGHLEAFFLIMNHTECEKTSENTTGWTFSDVNYPSLWLGIRLPKGPKYLGNSSYSSRCLKRMSKGGVNFNNKIYFCSTYLTDPTLVF